MARWGWSSFSFHFILLPCVNCFAPPPPTSLTLAASLFLHRSLSWPLFFLPSRLCPQPTNLLIGFYLRPNEVLLYWDNFSKSVTCADRLHLTFALINGEATHRAGPRPHAPRILIPSRSGRCPQTPEAQRRVSSPCSLRKSLPGSAPHTPCP